MAEHDVEMTHVHTQMGELIMRGKQRCFVETLLAKYERMMVPTIPGAIFSVCGMFLLELLRRDLDGEVNAMIVIAEPLMVLAMLFVVATWLCCHEWGSEVVAAITEIKGTLPMHQAASTEGESQERVWAFSIRYMTLVSLRTTYLFCFLLGLIFAIVGILRPPPYLSWILLSFALLSSVVVIISGSFLVYLAYGGYCTHSKSLTRIRPRFIAS